MSREERRDAIRRAAARSNGGQLWRTREGIFCNCEEHDDTRLLMAMLLEQAGFSVTQTACARDCLKLVEDGGHFDLYLLDHTFPDASGVALCEALRELDTKALILFYSGRALPQEREAASQARQRSETVESHRSRACVCRWRGWSPSHPVATSPPCISEEVEAGLVDADDYDAFCAGLFFSAGQTSTRHRSMAASSRWLARSTGTCGVHRRAFRRQ